MRHGAILAALLAGLCIFGAPSPARAGLSARPEIKTRDGATWLVVTITSRPAFTMRTRPRAVRVTAGALRLGLRGAPTGPPGRVWRSARLRGAQGTALRELAGRRVTIRISARARTTTLRRLVAPLPPEAVPGAGAPAGGRPPIVAPPVVAPPAGAPAAPKAEQALAVARQYLGTPYAYGGASPATGFDASGLVQFAYGEVGIALARNAQDQIGVGTPVGREALAPGDLVFFRDAAGYVFHVGLFAGGRQFLHAPRTGDVVRYSSLDEPYYAQRFAGARHIAG